MVLEGNGKRSWFRIVKWCKSLGSYNFVVIYFYMVVWLCGCMFFLFVFRSLVIGCKREGFGIDLGLGFYRMGVIEG